MSSRLERSDRYKSDKAFQAQVAEMKATLQKEIDSRGAQRSREQAINEQAEKKARERMMRLVNRKQGGVISATFQGKEISNAEGN